VIVACLGDSITAGSPFWDPDPAVRRRIGAALDERSQWQHWAGLRSPDLEFRNCGVYGQRTDEIAVRLDVCAEGADALVVQGGINDIAQGRPIDTAADNLRGMVRRGLERGLRIAVADVLAWNRGYPRTAGPIAELNDKVAAIAREEHVLLLRFHDTLADTDRPGRMRVEWTSDGDHPSIEGYRRLGELAFRLP
jgi:acyl-CoA thioesterase I